MKHLLKITDLSTTKIQELLDLSIQLNKKNPPELKNKNIIFAFEKPSLRTKVGTEVAINHLNGSVLHIEAKNFFEGNVLFSDSEMEKKGRESLKDTVKNVNQWCDAIFARVFSHKTLELLTKYAEIPVINALCDEHHPMQALADALTIQEHFGKNKKIKCAFVGDANNVAFSLFEILIKLGHNISFAGPPNYSFSEEKELYLKMLATKHKVTTDFSNNPQQAVSSADIVYTDTFVSMGEEDIYDEKIKAFKAFQVNTKLMQKAKSNAQFMHCLPAHRGEEVTNEVLDSKNSLIYQQAKNRMVTSKGVFATLLK